MEVCHFGFFCWPKGFIFFLVSGVPIKTHKDILKNNPPHILVGTPGRILGLTRSKDLKLDKIKHFVVDECDRVLEALGNFPSSHHFPLLSLPPFACSFVVALLMLLFWIIYPFLDMRRDVQEIFRNTPHDKQVMMFSATLSTQIRPVCRKFCQDVSSITDNQNRQQLV